MQAPKKVDGKASHEGVWMAEIGENGKSLVLLLAPDDGFVGVSW